VVDPLLYAAKRAIGHRQLTKDEARNTARRAFQNNPGLTSSEIGKAIGRPRLAVDSYIANIRAVIQLEIDLKMFRMNRPGIPQERITKRLGVDQKTIHNHLGAYSAKTTNMLSMFCKLLIMHCLKDYSGFIMRC